MAHGILGGLRGGSQKGVDIVIQVYMCVKGRVGRSGKYPVQLAYRRRYTPPSRKGRIGPLIVNSIALQRSFGKLES